MIGAWKRIRERVGGARAASEAVRASARAHEQLIKVMWSAQALDVLRRLQSGGLRAYLVGGTVRDALLHRAEHGNLDVATELLPEEVARRFQRVEPVGVRFGTVLIIEG